MHEVEVSWGRAAQVWWSLIWRGLLFGFIAGFIAGFVVGLVGGLVGASQSDITILGTLSGVLAGIPTGIWVTRLVLRKRFRGFRIALLSTIGSDTLSEPSPGAVE